MYESQFSGLQIDDAIGQVEILTSLVNGLNSGLEQLQTSLNNHVTDINNPHSVNASQAGAITGNEYERFMDRIALTPNLLDDPLLVSLTDPTHQYHCSFRFSYANDTTRSTNYPTPLQTGTIMGVRKVYWGSTDNIMVELTEWYPQMGRKWYRRWIGSSWNNWESGALSTAYPVGSIYMSVSPTNPASIFGGTWEAWGNWKSCCWCGYQSDRI